MALRAENRRGWWMNSASWPEGPQHISPGQSESGAARLSAALGSLTRFRSKPCKGETSGRPYCSALSELSALWFAYPGRRYALPWAGMLRPFGPITMAGVKVGCH